MWHAQLTPVNINFAGSQVKEVAGAAGTDTCWFMGSIYNPFTSITGGTWTVGANNFWGNDYVGWHSAAVTYYRNNGRAPCGQTMNQNMDFICSTGECLYKQNVLGSGFTATTVYSTRAGTTQTETWP
jgi:hypothetical protein